MTHTGMLAASAPATRVSFTHRTCRRLLEARLAELREGDVEIADGGRTRRFGTPSDPALAARLEIRDPRAYRSVVLGGAIGAAEAYAHGWWTVSDLTALIRIVARNPAVAGGIDGWPTRATMAVHRLWHRLRPNRRVGSRRNIAVHYDLGNAFFAAFLDPTLTYSCAVFPSERSSLEEASRHKLELVCQKLQLAPGDDLVEIGSGWGSLALHAARAHGCRVTTTTVSRQQHAHVRARVAAAGLDDRVRVLDVDYRDLPHALGRRFDKVASIEMIEAVGESFLDAYVDVCERLTRPGGRMLLQAIVIADERYESYRRSVDVIQRYIFPGGFLPSLTDLCRRLGARTAFTLADVDDITPHYPPTLRAWRSRLRDQWDELVALGYPESLLRLWEYYFCYSEAGFLERTVGDVQLLLTKAGAAAERPA
jgi:cyclopropane-fatty-acyl-phospholipid synthase